MEQMKILTAYYGDATDRAKSSYNLAKYIAYSSFALFFFAAILFSYNQDLAQLVTLVGAINSVVAGVGFYLYRESSNQLEAYLEKLYDLQKYLLANSFCELLSNDNDKDLVRSIIIHGMIGSSVELAAELTRS